MVEKTKYIEKLKRLHKEKSGKILSEEEALECFEKLICLVSAITNHIPINKIIIPKNGK